ncbi:MAG: hypothetical protein ABIH04_03115 [Planctomycetota bacterium]
MIELNKMGKWHQFLNANRVFLPVIVADESAYYETKGEKIPIDLAKSVKDGRLSLIETEDIEEIDARNRLESVFQEEELDDGEFQAIAILLRENREEMHFCTADRSAIIACSLLGLEDCCISLETVLTSCRMKIRLKSHFSEKTMKQWRKEGRTRRIQRTDWSKE